jgi:hypothetical protein
MAPDRAAGSATRSDTSALLIAARRKAPWAVLVIIGGAALVGMVIFV